MMVVGPRLATLHGHTPDDGNVCLVGTRRATTDVCGSTSMAFAKTIRLSSKDLEAIQKRALAGLPYQTPIASLLHKDASGRLRQVQRQSCLRRARIIGLFEGDGARNDTRRLYDRRGLNIPPGTQ
jgi:hypothetical protein